MVLNFARRKTSLILTALFFVCTAYTLEIPQLRGRVNDYAEIMKRQDITETENYLESLENSTGIQIAVLTVPSLEGEDIASFGIRTAEKWKLGQKDEDNGAILIVAYQDREVRIETGYGLEDRLTDTKSGLIIRNVIIPEFKNGNYSEGIVKGIRNMGGIASDNAELVEKSVLDGEEEDSAGIGLLFMIIWMIFIFFVLTSRRGTAGNFFFWAMANSLNRSLNSKSGHGGSSFGGGSFGGHSGGGFSGGGGSFGGGGASGKW